MTYDTKTTVLIGHLVTKDDLASNDPANVKREILAELEAQLESTIKTLGGATP